MNTKYGFFKPLLLSSSIALALAPANSVYAQACLDLNNNRLYLPATQAGSLGNYNLSFNLATRQPLSFELVVDDIQAIDAIETPNALYSLTTGQLSIPALVVDTTWWQAELSQKNTAEYHFEVVEAATLQAPENAVIDNACNTPHSNRLVVDTGQNQAYDSNGNVISPPAGEAFYGQDVDYHSAGFLFTDNSDGTVRDNNTELTWQQTPSAEKYAWQAAQDYCAALELGGQDDWRAPSLKELISIEDFSQGWPYIDTEYFSLGDEEIGKQLQFWSSNDYQVGTTHGGAASAFGLNYGTGHIKAYPVGGNANGGEAPADGAPTSGAPVGTDTSSDIPPPPDDASQAQDGELPPPPSGEAPTGGNVASKFVRCVRGDAYAVNEFVDNGDGTVSDIATGLMWMQADSGEGKDWENALASAENLEQAGYSDWRLPNVKELQSIVDYSGVYPAIDANFFQVTDADAYFWTSTSAYFSSVSEEAAKRYWAWYVAFGYAVDNAGNDSHGAGAVRYDTKVEGGPAGEDAERVYNYARAVRNIGAE